MHTSKRILMQVREEIQKEKNKKNRLSEHKIQVFR